MTAQQFMEQVKLNRPELPPSETLKWVSYQQNDKQDWGESNDSNGELRENVAEILFAEYAPSDRALVKYMLEQEILGCRKEGMSTENLRRLTFMLYRFGQLSDIPLLFEAKFDTSFDAGCALDIDLVYGLDAEATKQYYRKHPHEKYDIVGAIEAYEQFEHHRPDSARFIAYIKQYYQA
jgi:hypothetical protein